MTAQRCGPAPNNSDVSLITGQSYDPMIYIGNDRPGVRANVHSAGDPAVGATYNFSGARTLGNSNQEVLNLEGEYWDNPCGVTHWVKHVIVFARFNGDPWHCDVQQGDSGGPLYFRWDTEPFDTVSIRGMVTGKNEESKRCFAMKYTRIRDLLGYSIVTH